MAKLFSITLTLLLSVSASAQSINHAFQREIVLQRIQNGRVIQEHVRRSQFVYNDRGKLIERVLYKTPELKGVDDEVVVDFAAGRPTQPVPGVQMISRDYGFREFGSSVEVKDAWDAHWPKGSKVKVWFSSDFDQDRETLLRVLDLWNSLVPEVQFSFVGIAEEAQICELCLTVLRNPNLKKGGTFEWADRGDGLIVYGRVYLRRMDRNTLFSIFAHEIGHSLGLQHSDQGLMREDLPKGKMVSPSQTEGAVVRSILR